LSNFFFIEVLKTHPGGGFLVNLPPTTFGLFLLDNKVFLKYRGLPFLFQSIAKSGGGLTSIWQICYEVVVVCYTHRNDVDI